MSHQGSRFYEGQRFLGGHHRNGFINRGNDSRSHGWISSTMMPGMMASSSIVPVNLPVNRLVNHAVTSPPSSVAPFFTISQSSDSPPSINGYPTNYSNLHPGSITTSNLYQQQYLQRHPMSYPRHQITEGHHENLVKMKCLSYLSQHKSLLIVSVLLFLTGVVFAAISFIPKLDKDISHSLFLIGLMFSSLGSCVFVIMIMFSVMCYGCCFNTVEQATQVHSAETVIPVQAQNSFRNSNHHASPRKQFILSSHSNAFVTSSHRNNFTHTTSHGAFSTSKRKNREDNENEDDTSLEEFIADSQRSQHRQLH